MRKWLLSWAATSVAALAVLVGAHRLAYRPRMPSFDTATPCGAAAAWAARAAVIPVAARAPAIPARTRVLTPVARPDAGAWLGDPTAWSGSPDVRVIAERGGGPRRECVLQVSLQNPTVLGEAPSYWLWTETVAVRRTDAGWTVIAKGGR